MILHIAIFRWIEGTTPSQIDEALGEVRNLQTKIPGLKGIYCGENFSKWSKDYTHAVVVVAQDAAALEAYRNHPDHLLVASKIEKMEADGIDLDFKD